MTEEGRTLSLIPAQVWEPRRGPGQKHLPACLELTGTDWIGNYKVEGWGGPCNCPASHFPLSYGWLGGEYLAVYVATRMVSVVNTFPQ